MGSDKIVGFLKEFVCFATRAHDYVYANEGIRHNATNEFHFRAEKCRVVMTFHQFQHPIASAL